MNERIKQLIDQSITGTSPQWLSRSDAVQLAEMIVRDIHAFVDARDTAQILSRGILKMYGLDE
jgi:hypothetical protein